MDRKAVCSQGSAKVVLTCPPLDTTGLAQAIRERGNIPLRIGNEALLELPLEKLTASWRDAAKIPAQRVAALSWQLAHDIAEDDEPEWHCGEAAALFLLALRHHHACLERALTGCRIVWNDRATSEKVEYLD
jgi:hypothetical protein